MRSEPIPAWLWRASQIALLGTMGGVLVVLGLVLAGIADPRPIGVLIIDDPLDRAAAWPLVAPPDVVGQVVAGSYVLTLDRPQTRAWVIAPYSVRPPATIELVAHRQAGPPEAGYGLWWGAGPDEVYALVAVNDDGYLAVWESADPILDWRPFPHVARQGSVNRLRIDLEADQVVVRINDEVAARFDRPADSFSRLGFYAETFGLGGSVVSFEHLRVWQASSNLD